MDEELAFTIDGVSLLGDLSVPPAARGVIVFAHGSGSSRLSSRNRYVAATLRSGGSFGTLLFDLLTGNEDLEYSNRFDIQLLANRLESATVQLQAHHGLEHMPIGYFGASTGAAAAIVAAARAGDAVKAVVSRGGRPDLAEGALDRLLIPTLLIVGGLDDVVLSLNRSALDRIPAEVKSLEVVPGATHLFEEQGTLEKAAELTLDWFNRYLR